MSSVKQEKLHILFHLNSIGGAVESEKLHEWNEAVDSFFFSLQIHLTSGGVHPLPCALKNSKSTSLETINESNSCKLEENVVQILNEVLAKAISTSQVGTGGADSSDVRQQYLSNVICALRNVYRLLSLLHDSNAPTQIAEKLKTLDIFSFLTHIVAENSALAVNASMALFQGMRNDPVTMNMFIDELKGIPLLAEAFVTSGCVALQVSLVKHFHQLLGYTISRRMLMIFGDLNDALSGALANDSTDFVRALVATMAWAVRSEPRFPGNDNDHRADLVEEVLQLLLAIQPMYTGRYAAQVKSSTSQEDKKETMTQLGIILCDILHIPNADSRAYRCKLAVVMLLMDMPNEYSQYLWVNKGVGQLVSILSLQLSEIVIEKRKNSSIGALPILVVLNKLTQANPAIKKFVEDEVFPQVENPSDSSTKIKMNMKPIDAPWGSLRWKLIELMTSNDSNLKRCASELLWTICGSSDRFVKRTGYGNAVHMLGIKGLVQLPKGV
uniref:Uncharacterized protein n=1 Tax=Leptocylindrus danicus TaxID=163516 RepID=A0A7S2L5W3_9STRA|mmetsp:Transcript_32055/g.46577  ORF Transcript_32055/g.46577 Transcript_32055/m.46577 type:complete len:498 (+) Transcript_32055:258-1751(+)|eukprot:CAMPEP_0116022234 /NCGR_PEP_ID=MMETSP0321-20121206/10864_1 /TAXON_ID=163516 /ORGANISM="Leptocylindrus danicus var. danicus, Strain B650" /LENGTH=497 /DNA_ID=CAMNT_0003493263 /DNA_START=168 /DNA_END=1661 /DNA_ORIENTATION=+